MCRRHIRRCAAWVAGLALVWAGQSAAGQEKNRWQEYYDIAEEYLKTRSDFTRPGDESPRFQEQVAGRMVKFIDAAPADQLSFQVLVSLCTLQHGEVPERTAQHLLKHHLKNTGLTRLIAGQWTAPTPTRSVLLKALATAPDVPERERGLASLMLARDTFYVANETGDHDLSRHAERYANQFEKAFPGDSVASLNLGSANVPELLDAIRKAGAGKPAPKMETQDVLNNPFKLENLRGKVVLVFFMGSSAQYDRVRAWLEPHLARQKGRPVALVLVGTGPKPLLAKKVQLDPAPPVAVLTTAVKKGDFIPPAFRDWGMFYKPTAVLVDAKGTIRYRFTEPFGPPNEMPEQGPAYLRRLDAALDRLVGEAVQK